jgi:hypothetical protein
VSYGFKLTPTCLAAKLRLAAATQRHDVRLYNPAGLTTSQPVRFAIYVQVGRLHILLSRNDG